MGNSISSLNCSRHKKRKKRKKKLSDGLDRQKDSLDGLQTKAAKVLPRISQHDQSLVADHVRSSDKKHKELRTRADRTKLQCETVSENLSDIKTEVDKYLSWLTEQKQLMTEELAPGIHVQNAEVRLQNSKLLCEKLQSKQATIETMKGKVEELMRDLPQSERNVVEEWVANVCDQHQEVYSLAANQQKLLASSVEQREGVRNKIEQVYMWLQNKEKEVAKLHRLYLTHQDVEKQVERSKALQAETIAYKDQLDELQKRGQMLHVDCTAEESTEIDSKLSEINSRFAKLTDDIHNCHNNLRDSAAARKNFEGDLRKIDKWCRETEMRCATTPSLDASVELLKEQSVHYEGLQKTAKMFESLVKVIEETGQSFKPDLAEEDRIKVENQMKTANEKYQKCADLIQGRLHSIEDSLSTRTGTEEKIEEALNWIENIESDLKKLPKVSGLDETDGETVLEKCEAIGERLSIYQPSLTQLDQESERLRSTGQNSDASRIDDITTKYNMLQDQVTQERKKIQNYLTLQQQYQHEYQQAKDFLSECHKEMEEVDSEDLEGKMRTLEMTTEKMQRTDTLFIQLENKLQQLAMENKEGANSLKEKYTDLKKEADLLKKGAEQKLDQCKQIQNDCEKLESDIEEAKAWIEQTEDVLTSCENVDLDTNSMSRTIHKHDMIAKDAQEKVNRLKEKARLETMHYTENKEEIPDCIAEKVEQIHNLENMVTNAIAKKKEYLIEAEKNRAQFENSMKQINEWLCGAETLTDSGYNTLEFENLEDTLSEHQDYFHEASMCQDEVEQVMELSEHLLPTLNPNDTETLRQTLKQTTNRLNTVMAKSSRKQEMVESKIKEWKAFQDAVANVDDQLGNLQEELTRTENVALTSEDDVQKQIEHIKELSKKWEPLHLEVADVQDKAHELEKVSCISSSTVISKMSENVKHKWQALVSSLENKKETLSNIKKHWEDFTTQKDSVEKSLLEMEDSLPEVNIEKSSLLELDNQLRTVKDVSNMFEMIYPKVELLKESAQTLENVLPTAAAKVHIQEGLFNVLENKERLHNNIQKTLEELEVEVSDRIRFMETSTEMLSWLSETNVALMTSDSGKNMSEGLENIEKQKALQQEVSMRIEELEQMKQEQEMKYSEVPSEMIQQLIEIQKIQASVTDKMTSKQEDLHLIQRDRQEVGSLLKEVELWLASKSKILIEPVSAVSNCNEELEMLSEEFKTFKTLLDCLRQKGMDLIRHTPNSEEKQAIQKSLRDVNQQWLSLQSLFVKRKDKLSEIEKLSSDFQGTAEDIQRWLESANASITASKDSGLKEQMHVWGKLGKECELNQNKVEQLGSVLQQMEPLCNASKERKAFKRLHQQTYEMHAKVKDKLCLLEESQSNLEDYERSMDELTRWMNNAKSHLEMKDTNSSLNEQFTAYETVLEDIKTQKKKAGDLLDKCEEDAYVKEELSDHLHTLLVGINDFETDANLKHKKIQQNLQEEVEFESEMHYLRQAIIKAQDKLLSVSDESIDLSSLEKQVTAHNAVAAEIESYQERMNKINEMSQNRSKGGETISRSLLSSPITTGADFSKSGAFFSSPSLLTASTSLYNRTPMRHRGEGWKNRPSSSLTLGSTFNTSPFKEPKQAASSSEILYPPRSVHLMPGPSLSQMEVLSSKPMKREHGSKSECEAPDHSNSRSNSRPPSPTALCDDESMKPQSLHTGPHMLSLDPMQPKQGMRQTLLRASDPVMGASVSVPNLLVPEEELPPKRSTSFHSVSNESRNPRLKELNTAWNKLLHQIGRNEQQLQGVLQNQEKFKQAVQNVNAQLDRIQLHITKELDSSDDVDKCVGDFKIVLKDFEDVKRDITQLREQGRKWLDPSYQDSFNTMQSTFTMLSERVENLHALAEIRNSKLESILRDKERHSSLKSSFMKQFNEIEKWILQKKMELSLEPLPSENKPLSVERARALKEKFATLQADIGRKLSMIPDLAAQCDQICRLESAQNAKTLHSRLSRLRSDLGALQLAMIEKQGHLQYALRESQPRQTEVKEHQPGVQKLKNQEMTIRQTVIPSQTVKAFHPPDHVKLHQKLKADISEHRQLLNDISKEVPADSVSLPQSREDLINNSWKMLDVELAEKKRNLQNFSRTNIKGPRMSALKMARYKSHQVLGVEKKLDDLKEYWREVQEQTLQKEESLALQQKHQDILRDTSYWLNMIEEWLLRTETCELEDIMENNEIYLQKVRSLGRNIQNIETMFPELPSASTDIENRNLMKNCLQNTRERTQMVENHLVADAEAFKQSHDSLKHIMESKKNIQENLSVLEGELTNFETSRPVEQQEKTLEKIEEDMHRLKHQLEDLKRKEEFGAGALQVTHKEWQPLETQLRKINELVQERKRDISSLVSEQDQYEKILKDYAVFLEMAEEKVNIESITASSLEEVKKQHAAHQEMCTELELQRGMLNRFAAQIDQSTRHKYSGKHSRLINQTQVVLDKAGLLCQKLDRTANQWMEIDQSYRKLRKFLEHIDSCILQSCSKMETFDTLPEKINVFNDLKQELIEERSNLYHFVEKANHILLSVNCPALEKDISELAEKYISLNTDVSTELKRLESTRTLEDLFRSDSEKLLTWLANAMDQLLTMKKLPDSDQQSIGAIRRRSDKLLEFKKEMNLQKNTIERLLKNGDNLAQKSTHNSKEARDNVSLILSQWIKLYDAVQETEIFFHKTQMDLMPSRQALNELVTWLDITEVAVLNEQEKVINNISDVETFLQTFTGLDVEIGYKQLTVDFVNESGVKAPANELELTIQSDFAERLGVANKRWQNLKQNVKQSLKTMKLLHHKWEDFERAKKTIIEWFCEQEDKITRYHLIGHEVGVKQTLVDCKVLQDALKRKESEIEAIGKMGDQLIDFSYAPSICGDSIQADVKDIYNQWEKMSLKVQELQNVLRDFLEYWTTFNSELHNVNHVLSENEYWLQRYSTIGADLHALRLQLDKLLSLREKMEQCQPHFERLLTTGRHLTDICEPQSKREILKVLSDVEKRWEKTSQELQQKSNKFDESFEDWEKYEQEYSQARNWLTAKELSSRELLSHCEGNKEECVRISKDFIKDLDSFQEKMTLLYNLADTVTKNMDSTSISAITSSQRAIEQKLLVLRQRTSRQMDRLEDELSRRQNFFHLLSGVKSNINAMQRVLENNDTSEASGENIIRDKLNNLNDAAASMDISVEKLDNLNNVSRKLFLTEQMAKELGDLNRKWVEMQRDLKDRTRVLQSSLMLHKDFKTKCEMWKQFVEQIEMDISQDIAGNMSDLQKQQLQCKMIQSEMSTKQPILFAIINDGEQMLRKGSPSQRDDIQIKLKSLAEQWHSVLRRVDQRKTIISNSLHQWIEFKELSTYLQKWLTEKLEFVSEFKTQAETIQDAKNGLAMLKNARREMEIHRKSCQEIQEQGECLLLHCDESDQEDVIKTISMLNTLTSNVDEILESKCAILEENIQKWYECESDLEKSLVWLQDLKNMLSAALPCEYDQLQTEYKNCMDLEARLQTLDMQRHSLQEMDKKLDDFLHPGHLNVLHQRILLLNRMLQELKHQVSKRKNHIHDSMLNWAEFQDNVSSLHEWIDKMEYKIITDKGYHIEDVLHKFSHEYSDAMFAKEQIKDKLLEEGQRLLKISSDEQFADIQNKIQKTKDKWNHLKHTIKFRKRKLEETLLAVKQLDTSMANLRKWLANIERDLGTPVYFMKSEDTEITEKLQNQKRLQKDIEHHSPGIGSVLNLCEVLLHDSDACPTEVEIRALQTAMKKLDHRWRLICQTCLDRKLWIEETWITWENLKKECTCLENWLEETHLNIDSSSVENMDVRSYKEELDNYEHLMKTINSKFNPLKKVNEQYRKLAREGRTDHFGALKSKLDCCNKSWDRLYKRVSAILSNLRECAALYNDFKTMKDMMYRRLTNIEVSVNDIDQFHLMDIPARIAELETIKNEVNSIESDLRKLDGLAVLLMNKEGIGNARNTEKEMEDLRRYMKAVEDRVIQFSLTKAVDGSSKDFFPNELLEDDTLYHESSPEMPLELPRTSRAAYHDQLSEDVSRPWENRQRHFQEKETQSLQYRQEWGQFVFDVDNMLTWLYEAISDQSQLMSAFGETPSLDAIVKHHREFLMHLELKKTRIQSLNLLGKGFIDLRTDEGKKLHDKLRVMNEHWDKLCSRAIVQQRELQEALMQCQEFHDTIQDLLQWLESIEGKLQQCEPITLVVDESALWSKLRKLTGLKADLESNKEKIHALKESTDKLLIDTESYEMLNARDKMTIIANRQNALTKLCASYIMGVQDMLKVPRSSMTSKPK